MKQRILTGLILAPLAIAFLLLSSGLWFALPLAAICCWRAGNGPAL